MKRSRHLLIALLGMTLLSVGVGVLPAVAAPSGVVDISTSCAPQNSEVEQAASGSHVYEAWMGCSGIAFASSADGGASFSAPVVVPGSVGSTYNSWDPTVAVGPDGKVYVSFMLGHSSQWYPVVATSTDYGATFAYSTQLVPPAEKNWGDRPFVAVSPKDHAVYVTWDYGPDRTSVHFLCSATGSCGYSSGDVNVVVQKSTDSGKTFGPMTYVSPGFPASGGDSAPMVISPSGQIDVLYQGYLITDSTTYAMAPGYEYFTSSSNGGATWSAPVKVGGEVGTMSLDEWWIDGAIARDAGGNLYAAWDTQSATADIGWLAYSKDEGVSWSRPVQVTPDTVIGAHIMEVTGGPAGTAYVAWLSSALQPGYTAWVRTFTLPGARLSAPRQISTEYGDPAVWPGDTLGLSTLDDGHVVLSYGSATPSTGKKSDIFVARFLP
jgi:hypothetical protein